MNEMNVKANLSILFGLVFMASVGSSVYGEPLIEQYSLDVYLRSGTVICFGQSPDALRDNPACHWHWAWVAFNRGRFNEFEALKTTNVVDMTSCAAVVRFTSLEDKTVTKEFLMSSNGMVTFCGKVLSSTKAFFEVLDSLAPGKLSRWYPWIKPMSKQEVAEALHRTDFDSTAWKQSLLRLPTTERGQLFLNILNNQHHKDYEHLLAFFADNVWKDLVEAKDYATIKKRMLDTILSDERLLALGSRATAFVGATHQIPSHDVSDIIQALFRIISLDPRQALAVNNPQIRSAAIEILDGFARQPSSPQWLGLTAEQVNQLADIARQENDVRCAMLCASLLAKQNNVRPAKQER